MSRVEMMKYISTASQQWYEIIRKKCRFLFFFFFTFLRFFLAFHITGGWQSHYSYLFINRKCAGVQLLQHPYPLRHWLLSNRRRDVLRQNSQSILRWGVCMDVYVPASGLVSHSYVGSVVCCSHWVKCSDNFCFFFFFLITTFFKYLKSSYKVVNGSQTLTIQDGQNLSLQPRNEISSIVTYPQDKGHFVSPTGILCFSWLHISQRLQRRLSLGDTRLHLEREGKKEKKRRRKDNKTIGKREGISNA